MFILTLAMPEMMMVLFFTGDLSFCLADWWSCRMAASATGSVPLSTSNSVSEEDKALLTVLPSIDACSETRRSESFGLLAAAFWAGSNGTQSYLCPMEVCFVFRWYDNIKMTANSALSTNISFCRKTFWLSTQEKRSDSYPPCSKQRLHVAAMQAATAVTDLLRPYVFPLHISFLSWCCATNTDHTGERLTKEICKCVYF